ncbi:recombination protein U [Streptococcus pneumoniae]|nr:recombination protein U [Streptococcus pneumoniae]CMX61983.1 recombination protein U [Streptococcus pneumoniae]
MVNYPHKLSSQKRQPSLSQPKNFANRGMSFEKMINATNDYYLSQGLAVIHKKPTPIQIVRVDYPQRSRAKLLKPIFDKLQRRTILAFIMDITSTLKPRKQNKNVRFR